MSNNPPTGPLLMVDFQFLFNTSLSVILLGLGWAMRALFDTIKSLRRKDEEIYDKVTAISVNIPENYVHKNEFRDFRDKLFTQLNRIEDKVNK